MHSRTFRWCLVALLAAAASVPTGAVQCLGQDGAPVDWWIVLKYPNGYKSTYLDNNTLSKCTTSSCWSSTFDIRYDNAVTSTIKLSKNEATEHIFFNDADPTTGEEMYTSAHTKGAVIFDKDSGVWIVHSAPKYPARMEDTDWWILRPAQSKFGQHFACMSLTATSIDGLGQILNLEKIYMYEMSDITPDLQAQYPNLAKLMLGGSGTIRVPASLKTNVETFQGLQLQAFGKAPSTKLPFHIHEEFIESTYQVPMFWETWRVGGEPTFCPINGLPSYNNILITVPETGAYWNTTSDHSKWGVSADGNTPVACFGDLNRAESQAKRGGGFVCWTDAKLWSAVRKLVVKYENCSSNATAGVQ